MIMLTILKLYNSARVFAGVLRRVYHSAAITARRVIIYVCLAAAIAADWILDHIDPDNDNRPKPNLT